MPHFGLTTAVLPPESTTPVAAKDPCSLASGVAEGRLFARGVLSYLHPWKMSNSEEVQ